MNISQVAKLLNESGRKTIYKNNLIEELHEQSENYYKLEERDDKWIFLFVKCEKNSEGIEEIIKIFDNEEDASKYYYLVQLSSNYYNQYILPFEMNNKDINIGELECTISNLKQAFDRLGIKENYYSFTEVKNEHSILLNQFDNDTSQVKFIGDGCRVISETLKLDNWIAYYAMYKFVYYLFLLDKHCEILIKSKEIEMPFSDEEYSIFLK